jgi:ribosomal protein S18 acetylase RimI-like enzyme
VNDFSLRPFSFESDFQSVIQLWETAGEGIHIQRSDQPNEILKKLERDPDLFLVVCLEEKIIGTVIAGFDGRRGMIYHLAVAPEYRNQGIASSLMFEVEQRLKSKGCIRCYLFVTPQNQIAMQFYENHGWSRMTIIPFGKDLIE